MEKIIKSLDQQETLPERVELPVLAAHELWFEEVSAAAVVLELALVELHGQVRRLEVERHHLAAGVPEDLGHVVGRVHPGTLVGEET